MSDTWTEGRVADLTKLYAEGFSCRVIGEQLGLGRNAVIGKVHRLKLPSPVERKPVVRMGREVQQTWRRRDKVAPPPSSIELLNIPLLDAEPFQCRWIEGDDGMVCGHEVYQRSFCHHHYARCYTPPRKTWGAAA